MRLDNAPVLDLLRQALGYHSDRQKVIAENVANANTPGYTPSDIPMSEFERALQGQTARAPRAGLSVTQAGHIEGSPAPNRSFRAQSAPDTETTIDGNAVVLEEQMVRANENRMRYETAMGLYQKSLQLIRMSVRPPQ